MSNMTVRLIFDLLFLYRALGHNVRIFIRSAVKPLYLSVHWVILRSISLALFQHFGELMWGNVLAKRISD